MRSMVSDSTPIKRLGLSTRAYNGLLNLDCKTVGDARRLHPDVLRRTSGLGKLSFEEIRRAIGPANYSSILEEIDKVREARAAMRKKRLEELVQETKVFNDKLTKLYASIGETYP